MACAYSTPQAAGGAVRGVRDASGGAGGLEGETRGGGGEGRRCCCRRRGGAGRGSAAGGGIDGSGSHGDRLESQEIEKRAEDLKTALQAAQGSAATLTADLDAERRQHGVTRDGLAAASAELVTVKARAEAQAGVQIDQADRLRRVEAELSQARGAAAAAREETAQLRGQAEALTTQHAELMQVLKEREMAPKGGKKQPQASTGRGGGALE